MKNNILRSISKVVVLSIGLLLTSCYEDAFNENFDYTTVYLPHPTIDRTFIIDEGMRIGVGVVLGGTLNNTKDVEVTFSLDESLLDPGTKLPDDYYTLVDADGNPANNKIIIPAGEVQGFVYIKADPVKFLNDPISLGNNYALGFTLESVVNADKILSEDEEGSTKFKSTIITFSYINKLYGHYVQTGQYTTTDGAVDETFEYAPDISDIGVLDFTMIDDNTVLCDGLANLREADKKMNLVIAEDNTITIETAVGGVTVTDDGESFYDPETQTVTLNYSFVNFDGKSYKASDVLILRNRVVDGVNQPNYDLSI